MCFGKCCVNTARLNCILLVVVTGDLSKFLGTCVIIRCISWTIYYKWRAVFFSSKAIVLLREPLRAAMLALVWGISH